MIFDHRHYVPCLRWKLGEYQALLNLSGTAKDFITPLIDVPEIGYDHETRSPTKSIDKHLKSFAERVKKKWGVRSCYVDLKLIEPSELMMNGQHPLEFIFENLALKACVATPVTGIERSRDYQSAVQRIVTRDRRGICLRLGIEDAGSENIRNSIDLVLKECGAKVKECDLVLDLGAPPNFEPIQEFSKLVDAMTQKLPYLRQWRNFILLGTSFPSSMGGIKKGLTTIQRFEWLLYKNLVRRFVASGTRIPTFGDYAINHPGVLALDMRLVKPSATIRYTADDSWVIVKGPNVRDTNFEQYRDHCRLVMTCPSFSGAKFSYGDDYIAKCAANTESTGNLPTWRKVGTNHHLEKVVSDISSYFASVGGP